MYVEYSEAKELLVALKSLIVRALRHYIFPEINDVYEIFILTIVFPFRYSSRTYNIDLQLVSIFMCFKYYITLLKIISLAQYFISFMTYFF